MKKMLIPVLLSSLLAVQTAAAAPTLVSLGGIRDVVPQDSSFSKIKYKIVEGPAANAPTELQNLTEDQLRSMVKFLMPDPNNPPKNLSPELVDRLIDVLSNVDMNYKRPVPKAEWDQLLREIQVEFVKRNGMPGTVAKSDQEWEKAIDGMIGGFVNKLGDPHTVYMDKKQAKAFGEHMQGNFVGIGAQVKPVAAGLKLEIVIPGSPAEKAGLIDGDVVTAIDGVATKALDLGAAIDRLRGPAGSEVKVRVMRLGRPVTVVRAEIKTPDLFGKMAAPGIGYVYFSQFGPTTDERLFAKIDELKASGATGLIIDLRGNSGGLVTSAESIGSEFLQDRDVITKTKRQGKLATTAVTDGPGRYYGMRLAFILNGYSASASEILAAGLQEHGKAIVVGSVSYGKGSFQVAIPTLVPVFSPGGVSARYDGTITKVTEGGWYTPHDRSVQGEYDPVTKRNIPGSGGVKPDVAVTMSGDEEMSAMESIFLQMNGRPASGVKDAALDKAIEALRRR